jgi:hypothetical protein
MVLDTKKGLLRADKEKGQYVDSEKGNSKENRKKIFFFDIALTLEHRDCLRSSAKSKPAIQNFFFNYLIKLGQKILGLSGARGQTASALGRPERCQGQRAPRLGGMASPDPRQAPSWGDGAAGIVFFFSFSDRIWC